MNAPPPRTETHKNAMAILGLIYRESDAQITRDLDPPYRTGTVTDIGPMLAIRTAAETMLTVLLMPHTPEQEELIGRQAIRMAEALDLIEVEDTESW